MYGINLLVGMYGFNLLVLVIFVCFVTLILQNSCSDWRSLFCCCYILSLAALCMVIEFISNY
jgi:hypothetical protein